jgi:hypothetical protein
MNKQLSNTSASGEFRKLKHCRKYGWLAGDCERLTCSRCGREAFRNLSARITKATIRQKSVYFMTLYFDPKYRKVFDDLPMFADQKGIDERTFRKFISSIFRALRDKARRTGCSFEYVIVLALGKVKHRIHKVIHCHALITWLPDLRQHKNSRRKERLDCEFLNKKLSGLHMLAWVELPRSKRAVARYSANNAKSIIGKADYKNVRIYRFSEGYEQ